MPANRQLSGVKRTFPVLESGMLTQEVGLRGRGWHQALGHLPQHSQDSG